MKGTRSGLVRALRWFAVLACATGVALAVERSRPDSIVAGKSFLDWISLFSSDEKASVEPEQVTASIISPRTPIAAADFLYPVLFSRPAGSWRLDRFTEGTGATRLTQSDSPLFTQRSSGFSIAPMSGSVVSPLVSAEEIIAAPDGGPPPPPGFWIANASGNWSNPANWKDGIVASGATAAAHFDTLDITTDVTVTLDTSRLIGQVFVGDTNGTNRYDIAPGSGGQRLIFDSLGGTSLLQQSSTSAGDTISVPIGLNGDLDITNLSTAHPLQISGNIASNLPAGTRSVTFEGTVNVSGNITPSPNGGDLSLNIRGNVNLSGTNTYGGTTFVTGTLFVKGDNSGATGAVQVAGGGSLLSGIGTIGGPVSIFGGTITGGDTTQVGRLTLAQSLSIMASEGGGGIYLANLDGDTSDLLAIGGNLSIGHGTTLNIQGAADGTTTYILATFAGGGLSGMFDFVTGLPADYILVYTSSDIELIPIPEPATWVGGALTLGVIAFVSRRKLRCA